MQMRILIILLFGYMVNYSIGANSTTPKNLSSSSSRRPGDARGKRTLFHYGNYGHLRPLAQRRTGYAEPRAYYAADAIYSAPYTYQSNYVPEYSNYLTEYGHQQHQSQYVEPPEPIIEIIIKESNESLAPITPQPYVQKKKKEQVQVFYVNYKKDKHTNKLHLESPVPALTPYGHDHPEEEEEIIHYPPATSLPPLKTTTLRTIIHPDSEQYHSNSGIHVTFGTEDKGQYGHQFQEHNEESVLQSVVALPNQNNYIQETPRPSRFHGNNEQRVTQYTRSETGQSRNFGNNFLNNNFKGHFQIPNNQNQYQQHAQTYVSHTLQLPSSNPSQPFRQVHSHQYQITHVPPPNNHHVHHHPQQQPQQPQQQQQQQSQLQQLQPQAQQLQQQPQQSQSQQSQSQQQQQQQQQQRQQQHHRNQPPFSQHIVNPTQFPTKAAIRFPTQPPPPSKSNLPYQPIKPQARPQSLPPHKPIPIPLQNIQTEHNPQPSPPFNRIQPYRPQGHYIFQQPQPQPIPQSQPQPQQQLINDHRFNKPSESQFRQKPPGIPPRPPHKQQTPSNQHQFSQQSNQQFGSSNGHSHGGLVQQSAPNLGPNQNTFNSPPQVGNNLSADSEFIKSVSKFEQHITETVGLDQINQPFGHNHPNANSNEFSPSSSNVIHNIPAPQLGPTTSNPSFGQFDYNSPSNSQFANFVTQQPPFLSSTSAPQHYAGSTQTSQFNEASNSQVQIVTPVSSGHSQYSNQQEHANYNQNSEQPQIIPNSQPYQTNSQKLPPPGHSVSTIYTDALQEIEQRRQQILNIEDNKNNNNRPQNYVEISVRNKYGSTGQTSQQNQQQYSQKSQDSKSTTTPPSTTKPSSNRPHIELPDEVPEELRQQLLSSGILENADISVLDYDKLGDTALENLPPEHLAHFYGAGGAAQISGSSKILTVVKPNGDKVSYGSRQYDRTKQGHTLPKKQNVDLKVVRFDSTNQKSVTDKYIRQDSTVLPAVDISDRQYNRYLPLKVSGTQFPIPDVEELRGKKISSVVVLAPVDTLQSIEDTSSSSSSSSSSSDGDGRQERGILDSKQIKFIAGDSLKQLLKKPTKENFKKWLEKEAKTDIDLQSVVLLVVKNPGDEQEIFMYDISTQVVNKLNGELSSAFVNVAEENAGSEDLENANISDSGIIEKMSTVSIPNNSNNSGIKINDVNTKQQSSAALSSFSLASSSTTTTSERSNNDNTKDHHRITKITSGYSIKSK